MSLTFYGLLLVICGYAGFLFFDGVMRQRLHGATQVCVRLRRRWGDAFFLLVVVVAGAVYEWQTGENRNIFWALVVLAVLIIWQGFRYPKWHLKETGFSYGASFWPYEEIAAMRLSEDGVLLLMLTSGQQLLLPVAQIDDLEAAAAFLTDGALLNHLAIKGE